MSRHTILAEAADHHIVVGWDAALNTFFAQVINESVPEDAEGHFVVWDGTSPGEVATADSVIEAVRPYVRELPDGLVEALRNDQATAGDRYTGTRREEALRWAHEAMRGSDER